MPPEAKTVPGLMADLVAWINRQLHEGELPVPLIAALAHYQFATIHPYYDGNGRTARLLANLILHQAGYGLKGIYSLDEYYARQLTGYYEALTVGPPDNYHLGRAEADVTVFDPDCEWVFDRSRSASKSSNSPFYGWPLRGKAVATIVGGRKAWVEQREQAAA